MLSCRLHNNSVFKYGLAIAVASPWMFGCNTSANLVPKPNAATVEASPQTNVNVNFCTDPAVQQKIYLKTLIILDHSGSNAHNWQMSPDGSGAPVVTNGSITVSDMYATDLNGTLRYGNVQTAGTLLNYLANLPANDPNAPTMFFGLIDFNGSSSFPTGLQSFTSDIPSFYQAVKNDATGAGGSAPADSGDTSYLNALSAANTMITNDIQNATNCANLPTDATPTASCPNPGVAVASSYLIVFMSDGSPIVDITGTSGQSTNGGTSVYNVDQASFAITYEPTDQILAQVGAIRGFAQNTKFVSSVNMFTIYYYNPANNTDQNAKNLLAAMAKAGNGAAYVALSGSSINYANFLPPTKLVKYTLEDVFVTNSSVTWWDDGQLHQDTDMDGLPDDVEIAWGSDPHNASTDKNGVSDLVKYRVTDAQACSQLGSNGICQDPVTNYASSACSGIQSKTINGVVTFTSSDPDGMNDCEKTILNNAAGINNPDSNGDMIPDWLEFISAIPFQFGTAPAVTTPLQDGYTIYQKIKYSLPVNFPSQQLIELNPTDYTYNLVSSSDTQDCYTLTVSNIPVIGSNNTIRVDVIEKNPLAAQNYLYRIGKKQIPLNSYNITFNDWTNTSEIAAGTWSLWP